MKELLAIVSEINLYSMLREQKTLAVKENLFQYQLDLIRHKKVLTLSESAAILHEWLKSKGEDIDYGDCFHMMSVWRDCYPCSTDGEFQRDFENKSALINSFENVYV